MSQLSQPEPAEPEPPAPKRRGRPKAAPKPKPEPKPRGRPRKVTVQPEVQEYAVPPPPSADQLHAYVTPLLQAYAAHLQMSQQAQTRQRYRDLLSRLWKARLVRVLSLQAVQYDYQ